MLTWLLAPAHAASLTIRVCVNYAPVYEDAGPQIGDDHLTGRPARIGAAGAKVEVVQDEMAVYPNRSGEGGDNPLAWSGNLDASGCTGQFSASSERSYRVELTSIAKVAGNTVTLKRLGGDVLSDRQTGVLFHGNGDQQVIIPDSSMSRVMGALTYGLQHESAGVVGASIAVWTKTGREEPCPGTGCNHAGEIYFPDEGAKDQTIYKNVLLHELGHRIMSLSGGFARGELPKADFPGALGKCTGGEGHRRNTVEWQSLALIEGFAHFYASSILNDPGPGQECWAYSHYPVDWNLDGRMDGKLYSCSGPPVRGLGLADRDWLGHACGRSPGPGMANEYDYQRFFWDLASEGITVKNVIDVMAKANTPPWDPTWSEGNNIADRLLAAAKVLGYGDAWERHAAADGVAR